MTPLDFFEKAPFGVRIRYGPNYPVIVVSFIVRNGRTKYAHGAEEKTGQSVFLILEKERVKDAKYGYFDSVELVE